MITENRLEQALKYLSDTDEQSAEANANVKYLDRLLKRKKALFIMYDRELKSISAKEQGFYASDIYKNAVEELFQAEVKSATMGNKRDKEVGPNQVPTGYDENPVGPPKQKVSNYGTEASNFSRDPIGQQGTKADIAAEGHVSSKSVYHGLKSSLQKIKKEKQVLKEGDENGLLSEKNIKPTE